MSGRSESADTTGESIDSEPLENGGALESLAGETIGFDTPIETDTQTESTSPTCPRCGTRLVATTTVGSITYYGSPCGCRLRSTALE